MQRTIGVTAGAHSVFIEGPERFLDHLQSAGANTAVVYTHGGVLGWRGPQAIATDHGADYGDSRAWRHPDVWIHPDAACYHGLPVGQPTAEPGRDFAGRDVLDELLPAATRRGMQVWARILEGGVGRIDPQGAVRAVDHRGTTLGIACWANPAWQAWYRATATDLAQRGVTGLHWGCERAGPLSQVLLWRHEPSCFCTHCLAQATAHGVDGERARHGFRALLALVRRLEAGERPPDGALTAVLRLLFTWPEVLAYDRLWHEARGTCVAGMQAAAPGLDVGWHIWQYTVSFDLFQRATCDYARMAAGCRHLKPVLYHEIAGPRFSDLVRGWHRRTWLADLADDEAGRLLLRATGLDPQVEANLDGMHQSGLSAAYVATETRRAVAACAGTRCRVLPGIGLDIPLGRDHGERTLASTPERITAAIHAAADAGADGVLLCREYDEMRLGSLHAAGAAMSQASWRTSACAASA
jgi:hypothetical protein